MINKVLEIIVSSWNGEARGSRNVSVHTQTLTFENIDELNAFKATLIKEEKIESFTVYRTLY